MTGATRDAVLGGLAALLLPAAAGAEVVAATADRGRLDAVVRASGAETKAAGPSVSEYPRDLAHSFFDWLTGSVAAVEPGLVGTLLNVVRYTFYALATGVLLWLLLRAGAALWRWQRRVAARPTPATAHETQPAPAPASALEAEDWHGQLQARLAADDAPGAARALWFWLATRLVPGAVSPAWTSRDLLRRTGRMDLIRPIRSLDRMLYGAGVPAAAEVRALALELEDAVT